MAEGLQTPDGKVLDLKVAEQQSADVPAPPKMSDEQKAEVQAAKQAPKRRGRPPKNERARVEKPDVVKDDYTQDAQNLVTSVWTLTASIPLTQPYALPLSANADGFVTALAEGAKHNSTIRNLVSGTGENTWALQLGAVTLSTGMQVLAIMKDPQLRAEARKATQSQLQAAMRANGIDVPEAASEPDADTA